MYLSAISISLRVYGLVLKEGYTGEGRILKAEGDKLFVRVYCQFNNPQAVTIMSRERLPEEKTQSIWQEVTTKLGVDLTDKQILKLGFFC